MSADDEASAAGADEPRIGPKPTDATLDEAIEPNTSLKRKASPLSAQAEDDPSSKRPKLEQQDGEELDPVVRATTDRDSEKSAAPEDTHSSRPDGHSNTASTEQRPIAEDASIEPTNDEAADRLAAEARRASFSGSGNGNRRPNFSHEERKRGQRLFGGLLSTLSQTTGTSQQKKRQEIERRQQERVYQQKIEHDKRRADKIAKLDHVRKIEQVKFDEQVMQTRHSNMLARARNLSTKSEPRLYYRPWELTRVQEDTIGDQIRDAEATVETEVQEFKRQKEQRLRALGAWHAPSKSEPAGGEPLASVEDANDIATAPPPAVAPKAAEEKDHDDHGDEMVEAEEDTVIY